MGSGRNRGQPIPRNGANQPRLPMQAGAAQAQALPIEIVDSLVEAMVDGMEYGSLVNKVPRPGHDVLTDVVQTLDQISAVRGRPCIAYLGNVVKADRGTSGVDTTDDLPFQELVASVPADQRKVDVFLSTRGGSGQQIGRFVDCLRNKFDEVDFLIPSYCMSAGTLFALSGDQIWMTPNACLGPIDPQVPTSSGRFVPAQALLLLVKKLQDEGLDAMQNGQPVPWTAVRIIDTIDKRELGEAITATQYASTLAAEYLRKYKFRHWLKHASTGEDVTEEHRLLTANAIAAELASHDRWKSHGHAISRDVLFSQTRLQIQHPDEALERAIKRAWAICTWLFEKTNVVKVMASSVYRYAKIEPPLGEKHA